MCAILRQCDIFLPCIGALTPSLWPTIPFCLTPSTPHRYHGNCCSWMSSIPGLLVALFPTSFPASASLTTTASTQDALYLWPHGSRPCGNEGQVASPHACRRSYRVFSIDPATARDLDDALHIHPVDGRPGRWRVGVHIADVSHFITPYSPLDYEAGMRATSVYLVQRVIPMLPRLLCEELCSLNPGVERLAFSVEWELDSQGVIHDQWVGRSVIRSCAKLAYPMVQAMIENKFKPEECSAELHGGHTWDQVIGDSLALHSIAQGLRASRHNEAGAVRLNNTRLFFRLDKDGNPAGFGSYHQAESNQLVEEFMLLANMSVAKIIASVLPDRALLRRHAPPDKRLLQSLSTLCEAHGLAMDCSSSAALHASLQQLRQACPDPGLVEVLMLLATKPMQLAQYFCTGELPDPDEWRHYALAVPEYTHFTSPIRRYPDLVVHRLLAAALAMQADRQLSLEDVAKQHKLFATALTGRVAEHCNARRLAARKAQDASLSLYLCVMLRRQPLVVDAVVTSVGGDLYFAVYCPQLGCEGRVTLAQQGLPLEPYFDAAAKTLVIKLAEPCSDPSQAPQGGGQGRSHSPHTHSAAGGTAAAAAAAAAGRGGQAEGQAQGQQEGYAQWLAGLPEVTVGQGLAPQVLPLKLKQLDHVSLIATSRLEPGTISSVQFRLWLDVDALPAALRGNPPPVVNCAADVADAPQQAGAEETGRVAESSDFCIPYDEMLND